MATPRKTTKKCPMPEGYYNVDQILDRISSDILSVKADFREQITGLKDDLRREMTQNKDDLRREMSANNDQMGTRVARIELSVETMRTQLVEVEKWRNQMTGGWAWLKQEGAIIIALISLLSSGVWKFVTGAK